MAFIYEAERKPLYNPALVPGPGQYFEDNSRQSNRGYAPFGSTVGRGIGKSNKPSTKPELPGPGAYDPGLSISNSLKPNKTFHATLLPEKESAQTTGNSTVFKSKTKRFEHKIDTELPGPGAYYKDRTFEKAASTTHLTSKSPNAFDIKKLIQENKTNIPSIPSYVHSYGYNEAEDKKLQLNKNPLIEIQQFVGPGYYDAKEQFTPVSNKGTTWYKSGSKRFNPQTTKASNPKVGPGSYDVKSVEGAQPLYKTVKPSPAFESTSDRTSFLSKSKPKSSPRSQDKVVFEIGLAKPDIVVDNNNRHRLIDENGPGPGYYHNENTTSSLKLSYKPTKLQFFGSGSDRFKENQTDQGLGPGEYNVEGRSGKKSKLKAGFLTNEERLKGIKTNELGPGVYELNTTMVDRVKEKAKRGYLGSFGSTELRFKPTKSEMENIVPEKVELFKIPPQNPKPQRVVDQPKNTHVFTSKTEKTFANIKSENPPPGSYDVNYYDMAKKVIDSTNPQYNAKKAPFSTSDTRFKYRDSSNERNLYAEELAIDEHMERKRSTSYKPAVKSGASSVFSSKTMRGFNTTANNIPGPGSYQGTGTVSQDAWNKKTFNIKYLEERGK